MEEGKRNTPSKPKRACPQNRVAFKKGKVEKDWCSICVAEVLKANPGMNQNDVRKAKGVKQSTKGCNVCQEFICKDHWHLHGK